MIHCFNYTEVLLRVQGAQDKGNSCQYNYNEASIESVLLTLANAHKYHKAKPGVTAVNMVTWHMCQKPNPGQKS